MGSTSIPQQPAPPDYGAANREGIYTDIDTLPTRRAIDQGARLGQLVTYVDPRTGETRTADFTGMGDDVYARNAAGVALDTNDEAQRRQLQLRQELGVLNARQTAKEIEAADPLAYATRQALTGRLKDDLASPAERIAANRGVMEASGRLGEIGSSAPGADRTLGTLDQLQRMGLMSGVNSQRQLGSIYDAATRLPGEVSDSSTSALNMGLQRAVEDFNRGGELDPDTKRELLNEVRSGQAARGNYLGDAAAVAEGTELGGAMEARRAQRLQSLLDVQQRAFGQNSQLRGESTANQTNRLGMLAGLQGQGFGQQSQGLGQLSQLAGQYFGTQQQGYQTQLAGAGQALGAAQAGSAEERAARGETFGRDQQKLANASAMVLGQPITNQFGSLQGAQQGAVGFNPMSFNGGTNLNSNAGNQAAQYAQGNYGNMSNMWTTQADINSQNNQQMMQGLGTAAGMAAMMFL